MASFDEVMKRQALARQPVSAQMSPAPRNELERQRIVYDNRMNDIRALTSQRSAIANEMRSLPPVQQQKVESNFLTRRSKNPVLGMLQGLVSQRLISKGLMQDPTDIARSNYYAQQSRDQELQNLERESNYLTSESDRLRRRAVMDALQAGVPGVTPDLGFTLDERLKQLNRQAGGEMTPLEDLSYARSVDIRASGPQLDQTVRSMLANNEIDQLQANSVLLAATPEMKKDAFDNLVLQTPIGNTGYTEGRTGAGAIVKNPRISDDQYFDLQNLGFVRTPIQVTQDDEAASAINEYFEPAAFTNRAKTLAIYESVLPKILGAAIRGDATFSGPIAGLIPDDALVFLNDQAVNTKNDLRTISQQSLRETLGGQFAVQENIQLQQNFYNPSLPPLLNFARIRRSQKVAQEVMRLNEDMAEHLRKYKSLANGPRDENGEPIPFKRRKLSEVFESLNAGADGLSNLMSEFSGDELKQMASSKIDGEYEGEKLWKLVDKELQRRKKDGI